MRESKDGGCVLLVFLTVGLAIFSFGLAGTVGPYAESLQANGDPRFFLAAMAFGAVFFLIALRILQLNLTDTRNSDRGKLTKTEHQQPWTVDYPWRREGMSPDYAAEGGGSVLGRVAFLGLLGLFNMVFVEPSPWLLRGIVLFFDLFGLLILGDSLHKIWQGFRHPRPQMRWMTFPAFLGDRLMGVFVSRPALRVQGPIRATLRAIQDEGGGAAAEPFILYEQIREFLNAGDRMSELALSFDIPQDLPGTNLAAEQPTYWQVLVQVPVTGPDFETVFLAPVYKGSDGPPAWQAG